MAGLAGEEAAAAPPRPRAAKTRKSRRRRGYSPRRVRAEYLVLRAVIGGLAALPLGIAMRVGEAVMWLVILLAVPLRRVGMTNLAIAFPEKPVAERRRILHASMLNLGRMVAELAHLPQLDDAALSDMVRSEDETWWREAIGW